MTTVKLTLPPSVVDVVLGTIVIFAGKFFVAPKLAKPYEQFKGILIIRTIVTNY